MTWYTQFPREVIELVSSVKCYELQSNLLSTVTVQCNMTTLYHVPFVTGFQDLVYWIPRPSLLLLKFSVVYCTHISLPPFSPTSETVSESFRDARRRV